MQGSIARRLFISRLCSRRSDNINLQAKRDNPNLDFEMSQPTGHAGGAPTANPGTSYFPPQYVWASQMQHGPSTAQHPHNLMPTHAAVGIQPPVLSPRPRLLGLRAVPGKDTPNMLDDKVEPKQLSPVTFATKMSSESVKIVVGYGQDVQSFNLPKNLLTWVSPFFKGALDQKWNANGEVRLGEDTAAAFILAVSLICRPDYTVTPELQDETESPAEFITNLIELASLGQSLIIPMLVHAAVLNFLDRTIIRDDGCSKVTPDHVELTLEKLEGKSQMRRAIIASVAREYIDQDWTENKDIENDWKFAGVVRNHRGDGFIGELLMAVNDAHQGRVQKARIIWDHMLDA